MDGQWVLVIVLWTMLMGGVIGLWIYEENKTPAQKQADAEAARQRSEKALKDEEIRRQRTKYNAPAKGCLQSVIELFLWCGFLMFVAICCIMVLIATGD